MSGNKYAKPANFQSALRTPLLREHFVYRAFDASGRLLYVGCSARLGERMKGHKASSEWWPLMARVTTAGPYNYETARLVEYEAIESERSLFNSSSERKMLARLHNDIVKRHLAVIGKGALDHGTILSAIAFADAYVPYSGREAIEINDDTVLAAHRARRRAFQIIDSKSDAA